MLIAVPPPRQVVAWGTGAGMGFVSRFMSDPGKKHWEVVKGILRYLSGTKDMCICFGKSNSGVLG